MLANTHFKIAALYGGMSRDFSKNAYFICKVKIFGRPSRVERHDRQKNRYRPTVVREKKSRGGPQKILRLFAILLTV